MGQEHAPRHPPAKRGRKKVEGKCVYTGETVCKMARMPARTGAMRGGLGKDRDGRDRSVGLNRSERGTARGTARILGLPERKIWMVY